MKRGNQTMGQQIDLESAIREHTGMNRETHLKCSVLRKKFNVANETGNKVDDSIFFLPDSNSEYIKFVLANNPENFELVDYIEFVAILGHPVNQPVRVAYHTGNHQYHGPHFKLLTVESDYGTPEQVLKDAGLSMNGLRSSKTIELVIQPDSEEENYAV